ncbi:MAG TPA: hypothetical protein VK988_04375 [Acidimicrobiales bacterium]|nr:hypothetical protein [Acidimicrobiales bacterium]
MAGRRRRPDLDERFSLHPMEVEDVLRKLLDDEDETATEDEDS